MASAPLVTVCAVRIFAVSVAAWLEPSSDALPYSFCSNVVAVATL